MIRGAVLFSCEPVEVVAGSGTSDWTRTRSWIEYYDHPVLSMTMERTGRSLTLSVSRTSSDSKLLEKQSNFSSQRTKVQADFTEYVFVTVEQDETVTLETGPLATIPLFWTSDKRGVYFSWKIEDLVSAGLSGSIDSTRARQYIYGTQVYEPFTFFTGIKLLTERSSIQATSSQSQIHMPENSLSLETRALVPGADICGAYMSLFSAVIEKNFKGRSDVCLELSGGFDSSNVALASHNAGLQGLTSYGLIFPGAARSYQMARRNAIVEKIESVDTTFDIQDRHFLDHWLTGSRWVNPYEEIYRSLVDGAIDSISSNLPSVMLTGIGGDEALLPRVRVTNLLMIEAGAVNTATTPKSVVPETALLAAISRAPMFMQRGVWPSNPYCFQEMINFSERLPDTFKQGRSIQRQAMERWGVRRAVIERPVPENFETVLRAELARIQPKLPKVKLPIVVELDILSIREWEAFVSDSLPAQDLRRLNFGFRTLTLEHAFQGLS